MKKIISAEFQFFSTPHGKHEIGKMKNILNSNLTENIKRDIITNDVTMKTTMSIDTNKKESLIVIKNPFVIQYLDLQKLKILKQLLSAKNLILTQELTRFVWITIFLIDAL